MHAHKIVDQGIPYNKVCFEIKKYIVRNIMLTVDMNEGDYIY